MKRTLIFFISFVFLTNLIQAIFTPLVDDEAYYWVWSKNISVGYFDHPPFVAWLIYFSNLIFNQELGIRFFTVVLNSISAYLFWRITNPKNQYQQFLTFCIYLGAVLIQTFSFVTTPDAPLLFFTLLFLYSLKRFYKGFDGINSLLFAISLAGLMYSKYHGLLLIVFSILPNLFYFLKRKDFYAIVLMSLIFYLPHFIWLVDHEFVPFQYHLVDRNFISFEWKPVLNLILGGLFLGNLGLTFHFWKSFRYKQKSTLFLKSIFAVSILPLLFFIVMSYKNQPQVQWLLISFVAQMVWLYEAYKNSDSKLVLRLAFVNVVLVLLARIYLVLPGISFLSDNKIAAQNIGKKLIAEENVVFEKYQEASLFAFYNDKKPLMYRTIGNRKSQFYVWDTEQNLEQKDFTFVSRWTEKNDSVLGWKNHTYYLKKVKKFSTYHQMKFRFLDEYLEVKTNENVGLTFDLDYPYSKIFGQEFKVFLVVVQGEQYNIVKQIEIPYEYFELKSDQYYTGKIDFVVDLPQGEYVIYLGIVPNQMSLKYQSDGLSVRISE